MHTEAFFAALCGVSPANASSGKPAGGDSNVAATAAQTPSTASPSPTPAPTDTPATTSTAGPPEGAHRRETIGCVKGYITREVYHLIQQLNTAGQPHEPLDQTLGIEAHRREIPTAAGHEPSPAWMEDRDDPRLGGLPRHG